MKEVRGKGEQAGAAALYVAAAIAAVAVALPSAHADTETAQAVVFYVAPGGRDSWSGRLSTPNARHSDGPFASIAAARDAIRRLKERGLRRPVRVIIRGGTYDLGETLVFGPEDSGTASCPITYQAARGEKVVLRGGKPVSGWHRVEENVFAAELRGQGLGGARFHQLFWRGRRQVLARHPNFDGAHPRAGGFVYVADRALVPREQLIYEKGALPFERWSDISQAEIVSTYCGGWNFAITPIRSVDTSKRIITFRKVRRTFEPGNRFYVQNIRAALDAPGEWFLDYKTDTLYFWPPSGEVRDGEVVVPVLDHIIVLQGSIPYPHGYLNVRFQGSRDEYPMPADQKALRPVQYITFRGIRMECARQDGLRMIGARHCSVLGCQVTNVGGVGINLGGVVNFYDEVGNPRLTEPEGVPGGVGGAGQDLYFNDPCQHCRIAGNDVFSTGSDGIFIYGTANLAENNHVYDTGLFDKDCACINLWGEENVARRNTLHDVPRNAIFIKGVDNVAELNEIRYTMLETCDGGAIRMCQRNLKLRGNVIRFNRILDTVGYGHPRLGDYQSPYYSWGVYLDDFTCGTAVRGNIIARTGRGGVMLHGGSDNIVDNNIIVDAGMYSIEILPIARRAMTGSIITRNIIVADGDKTAVYRASRWTDDLASFARNVVWARGKPARVTLGTRRLTFDNWHAWLKAGLDNGSILADPRFVNPAADDYRLGEDSPVWKVGFQRIPVDDIGCYASAERATWPLRTEYPMVREEPVLHRIPPRPLHEDFEMEIVGRRPRHGDVLAHRKAPIVVTKEQAAEGEKSLKIADAAGLPRTWEPRIFWALKFRDGKVRFSCDFFLDPAHPPRILVDLRQYSDTGGREYLSGPSFVIAPDGTLLAGGQAIAKVPLGKWFRIEMTIQLGPDAPSSTSASLSGPGYAAQTFEIPHGSAKFQRLERIVISALADGPGVVYVDNVICEPVRPAAAAKPGRANTPK